MLFLSYFLIFQFTFSSVLFAIDEPEPGISISLTGAIGLFALKGAGLCKTLYIKNDIRLDITPIDLGIKALCYSAHKTANLYSNQHRLDKLPVYILSSYTHNDLTFPQMIKISEKYWIEAAFEKNFLIPGLYCTDNEFIYKFLVIIYHKKTITYAELKHNKFFSLFDRIDS